MKTNQFPLRLQKRRDKEDLSKEMFNRKKGEEKLLRKFTMRKFTHKKITKLIKNLEEKVQTEEDREKVGVLFESLNERNDPATRQAKAMYLKIMGKKYQPLTTRFPARGEIKAPDPASRHLYSLAPAEYAQRCIISSQGNVPDVAVILILSLGLGKNILAALASGLDVPAAIAAGASSTTARRSSGIKYTKTNRNPRPPGRRHAAGTAPRRRPWPPTVRRWAPCRPAQRRGLHAKIKYTTYRIAALNIRKELVRRSVAPPRSSAGASPQASGPGPRRPVPRH